MCSANIKLWHAMPIYNHTMGKTYSSSAGGSKEEAAPKAASIPEQPKEAAKDAVSAIKAAAPEQPKEAAKDAVSAIKAAAPEQPKQAAQGAASAAKDALPDAPKELSNPLSGLFGGARLSSDAKHITKASYILYIYIYIRAAHAISQLSSSMQDLAVFSHCMLPCCHLAPKTTAHS